MSNNDRALGVIMIVLYACMAVPIVGAIGLSVVLLVKWMWRL